MPDSEQLVPSWFAGTEAIFPSLHVPESIRVTLIMLFLTKKMRAAAKPLGKGVMLKYVMLKEAILQELKLSPAEYRNLFHTSRRSMDESWSQFASMLGDLLG